MRNISSGVKSGPIEYLKRGDLSNAIASMMSDMKKHPETKSSMDGILGQLGMVSLMSGNPDEVRRYIDGFN